MPARARGTAVDIVADDDNEENIPPQGRRSERVKGRKSASIADLGMSIIEPSAYRVRT
jgi:hypothetical protein